VERQSHKTSTCGEGVVVSAPRALGAPCSDGPSLSLSPITTTHSVILAIFSPARKALDQHGCHCRGFFHGRKGVRESLGQHFLVTLRCDHFVRVLRTRRPSTLLVHCVHSCSCLLGAAHALAERRTDHLHNMESGFVVVLATKCVCGSVCVCVSVCACVHACAGVCVC